MDVSPLEILPKYCIKEYFKRIYLKRLYNNPKKLTIIEFANRIEIIKYVWVDPSCVSIEIDSNTEYQVITHDKTFRIEFDKNETIIFYLQYTFGFKLYKRQVSKNIRNSNPWILDIDFSEIN